MRQLRSDHSNRLLSERIEGFRSPTLQTGGFPMAEISPLRRRMIEDMTVRNLSPATQQSYLSAVSKFSRYFGRSPDRLGLEDVRAFQVHLVSAGISWPALNQTVCALRFFYGVTLGHGETPERIPYARQPRKLPVVLSADEVVRFLEAVPSLKSRAALTTAYAAGLRASEAASLKVADIDSGRMVIRIEQGKGGRDRYAMLSPQLLGILRSYWRGWSREVAAEACAMERQTLRDWVHRYNQSGLEGLADRPRRNGPRPRLSAEQQAKVAEWVEQGPDLERDGVVRWRCVDLQQRITQEFAVTLHERTVGKLLFRRLSVRPRPPAKRLRGASGFLGPLPIS